MGTKYKESLLFSTNYNYWMKLYESAELLPPQSSKYDTAYVFFFVVHLGT